MSDAHTLKSVDYIHLYSGDKCILSAPCYSGDTVKVGVSLESGKNGMITLKWEEDKAC